MPITANCMRMEAEYSGPSGATAFNILHFVNIGGDFDGTTVDYIADAWVTESQKVIADSWTVARTCRFLDLRTDPPGEIFSAGASEAGDNTSEALPPNVAMAVSLSAGASRRRRGRFFVPGIPTEFVTAGGQLDPAYLTGISGFYVDFIADVATNQGWVLGVFSRLDNVVRGVNTLSIRDLVDTQRRRIRRIGE